MRNGRARGPSLPRLAIFVTDSNRSDTIGDGNSCRRAGAFRRRRGSATIPAMNPLQGGSPVAVPAPGDDVASASRPRWPLWGLLGVLALTVGVPVVLAIATGAIAIPHNDAWSHSRIAQAFAAGDGFQLVGWNRTALVGQVVVLGPLGATITAQQLSVAVWAVVGLLATYGFLSARVSARRALLGTLVVGLVPEFALLATSFMSDIPAFAAMMLCLAIGDVAVRRNSVGLLALSALVGLWGVTIREQAVAAPVAVLVAALWTMRSRRRGILAVALVAGGLLVAFELWRRSLPYGDPPQMGLDLQRGLMVAVRSPFTLSLVLLPALLLVVRPRQWSRAAAVAAVAVPTLGLLAAFAVANRRVLMPNYLDQDGPYADVAVGTRQVIGGPLWLLLTVASVLALGLLVGHLLTTRPRLDVVSCVLAVLLVGGTLAQAVTSQTVFFRYLIPLVPVACVAVLREPAGRPEPARERWAAAAVGAGGLLGVSLLVTTSAMSFDVARWEAASDLVRAGWAANRVDAGLEWVGYHTPGQAMPTDRHPDAYGPFMDMFPNSEQCVVIAAAPLGPAAGTTLVGTHEYASFTLMGTSTLWIYQVDPCR